MNYGRKSFIKLGPEDVESTAEDSMNDLAEYFSLEHYPKPYCDIVNQGPIL
jgi:hypothetical protein